MEDSQESNRANKMAKAFIHRDTMRRAVLCAADGVVPLAIGIVIGLLLFIARK